MRDKRLRGSQGPKTSGQSLVHRARYKEKLFRALAEDEMSFSDANVKETR